MSCGTLLHIKNTPFTSALRRPVPPKNVLEHHHLRLMNSIFVSAPEVRYERALENHKKYIEFLRRASGGKILWRPTTYFPCLASRPSRQMIAFGVPMGQKHIKKHIKHPIMGRY